MKAEIQFHPFEDAQRHAVEIEPGMYDQYIRVVSVSLKGEDGQEIQKRAIYFSKNRNELVLGEG